MGQPVSANFFVDNDDLRFQLARLDWALLVELQERAFMDEDRFTDPVAARTSYEEMLTALGEFIAKEVAPFEHELDEQHPTFADGQVCLLYTSRCV